MKKNKLLHYAEKLADHADSHWVAPIFLLMFFVDSFIMLIPADSLLSATVALQPKHVKKWFFASVLGAALGFGLLIFLSHTVLHEYLLSSIHGTGFYSEVGRYLEEHANHYGLWELAIAVYTVVPMVIASLAGVAVGLNPWAIFAVVMSGKIFRMALSVWLVHTSRPLLKKIANFYMKTSV